MEFCSSQSRRSVASQTFSNSKDLAHEEVRVRGSFTSLTFKDFLVSSGASGFGRLTRRGVGTDYVGVVTESKSSSFSNGDEVCLIGTELGSGGVGGVSETIVAPASTVRKLPRGWSAWETIVGGTPAMTASLAWQKVLGASSPRPDSIAISGVGGGVGLFSLLIANIRGVNHISVFTQKTPQFFSSKDIRVDSVLSSMRSDREHQAKILPKRWESGIDVMGGSVLQTMLKACSDGGAIVALGVVANSHLSVDLAPFFLRGIHLLGANLQTEILNSEELQSDALAATRALLDRESPKVVPPSQVPQELENRGNGTGRARVIVDLEKFD